MNSWPKLNCFTWYLDGRKWTSIKEKIEIDKKALYTFHKTYFFSKKNPKTERFEISCYSSHFLRQIYYSLVEKSIHAQKRERTCRCDVMAWAQAANTGWKEKLEMAHLRGRFCFLILEKMAQNRKKTKLKTTWV